MKTDMKNFIIRTVTAVIIFVGCFLTVFISLPVQHDYFDVTFTPDGVYNYNVMHHTEKDSTAAAGEFTISPFMMLKAGEYNIKLNYKTQKDIPLYAYYLSEYDTNTKEYPKIHIGTLSNSETSLNADIQLDHEVYHVIIVMDYPGECELSITDCTVRSTKPLYNNRAVYAFAVAAAFTAFYAILLKMWGRPERRKNIATVLLLAVMVVISSAGMLSNDVILGDDLEFHMLRLLGIGENIAYGVPFSRINHVFNGGYGYLNPVFYPQLFLWPFGLLTTFGADAVCAYKILIFAINTGTVVLSYTSFKKISNCHVAALICSAVYCLNYYRIGNIYIRAAVGELLYIMFLPVVFWGIYEIFHNREEKWYILAIGAACILQSHILGTLLTAIGGAILIFYYVVENIFRKRNLKKQIAALIKAAFAVVMLNVTFLLPIVYYLRQPFYMFDAIDSVERFSSFAMPLYDMLLRIKDFDYSSFISHLGTNTAILIITVAAIAVVYLVKNRKYHESIGLWLIAVMLLIAASDIMPWDVLGSISVVEMIVTKLQFSFRLNTLTVMFITFACAALLRDVKMPKLKTAGAVLAAALVVIGCGFYIVPGYEAVRGFDGSYAVSATSPPEYFMKDAAYYKEMTRTDKFRTSEGISVTMYQQFPDELCVNIDNASQADGWIDVPLLYYSGYTAQNITSGNRLEVTTGENFVVRVLVPQGESGNIAVKYKSMLLFNIADIISFVSLAMLIVYIIYPDSVKKLKDKFTKTVKN